MLHSNSAFNQLLKPLSRHEFEVEAEKHHVGQKLRSVIRRDKSNLETRRHKLTNHLGAKPTARSMLARLNEKQPAALYETVFSRF